MSVNRKVTLPLGSSGTATITSDETRPLAPLSKVLLSALSVEHVESAATWSGRPCEVGAIELHPILDFACLS